jgi:hypothetical protein
MPWLKIDDGMWSNPKWLTVSPLAKALWVWAASYSSDKLTDGVMRPVDWQAVAVFVGVTDWRPLVDELREHHFLDDGEGDTLAIHDYLKYNPSKADVQAEREATRKRMCALRSGAQKANTIDPVPVPSRPVPIDDDDAPEPELDKAFGDIWSLYVSEFLVNPASIVNQEVVADLVKMSRDPTIHREAIKRARKGAASNRPSLRYIEAILESYLNTGSWEKPGGNGHKPPGKGRSASRETDYSKIQASAPVEPYVPMTPEEKDAQARELAAMGLL